MIQKAGLDFIFYIQTAMPGLENLMQALSMLGTENFFMAVIGYLLWCRNRYAALRLLALLIFCDYVNLTAKWIFFEPRPYWIDARLTAFAFESTFGIPSGHAQDAVVFWGYLAMIDGDRKKLKGRLLLACSMILAICFSRMYLAVHFPHDILLGLVLGLAVLLAGLRFLPVLEKYLLEKTSVGLIQTGLIVSALMLALSVIIRAYFKSISNVYSADPWSMKGAVISAATAGAIIISLGMLKSNFDFRADKNGQKLLRFIIGIAGVAAIMGIGTLLPSDETLRALELRYLKYFLMSFWACGAVYFIFQRAGLARNTSVST